jgi:hypothetical protein
MEVIVGLLIAAAFFIGMIAYYSFSWGYVISVFYGWFVLSAIPTLPHFTVLQFVGFSLFCNALIRGNSTHLKDEYKDEYSKKFSFFGPWLVLLVGYVIHSIWF